MSIFGGSKAKEPEATLQGKPARPAVSQELSIIAPGTTVRGDIDSNGIVKVEGTVEGQIHAAQQVLIAKGGEVIGDIDAREAVIGGVVQGSITAGERVEIQAGATVSGDITTKRIAVAEGARLDGQIRMGGTAEPRASRSSDSGAESRSTGAGAPSYSRPSVPLARVAVPPRPAGSGSPSGH